jgi:predicted metal-dependent hydrolase
VQLGLPFGDASDGPPVSAPPEIPLEMYFVRHRRARRYVLRVDGDGRVRVTIPRGGSKKDGEAFARRQIEWIVRQRARLVVPASYRREERDALRARAGHELPLRLLELARLHAHVGTSTAPLRVSRISIRNQRTRWGSCGPDGHICLNWRLVLMPDAVRDYVLVHELMHLRRLDHSPAYWKLVEAACPDFRQARLWLRQHGPSLR